MHGKSLILFFALLGAPAMASGQDAVPPPMMMWPDASGKVSDFAKTYRSCTKDSYALRQIAACDAALKLVDREVENLPNKQEERIWFLASLNLHKSIIYRRSDQFADAIKSADIAAIYLPDAYQIQQQRCWVRAVANTELETASEACSKAFSKARGHASRHG
jgi:hypothetical protein